MPEMYGSHDSLEFRVIDFKAARRRVEALVEHSIEIDASCLAVMPRGKTLAEMLRECTEEVGTFGVREELFHNPNK